MNDLARHVQTACLWEATARKAGNVHRFADFDDLTYMDFVLSASAIAPVLSANFNRPLGFTILEAIRATRLVVSTNTNLGIVLLLAPLSKCQPSDWRPQLNALLDSTTIEDAALVFEAIRLAMPGGLGKAEEQDIAAQPTQTLREVMALAADKDMIARQYANAFNEVVGEGQDALLQGWNRFGRVEAAILHLQLHFLSRYPDSLIVRKRGIEIADKIRQEAREIDLADPQGVRRFEQFDRQLRADGHSLNPGTTADLVSACLFVALREHRIALSWPFSWDLYG